MPQIILVQGQCGVGKGTTCQQLVAQNPELVHLSVGDMLRDVTNNKKKNAWLAARIAPYVSKNEFIPDPIISQIVAERLKQPDLAGQDTKVLLDGYPRTADQAMQMQDSFTVDRVLLLQCADSVSLSRIKNRLVDPVTHAVYNKNSNMPEDEDITKRLVARPFDLDEAEVKKRLERFHDDIDQVIAPFVGKVFTFDTSRPMDQVAATALHAITDPIPAVARTSKVTKGAFAFMRFKGAWEPRALAVGQGAPPMEILHSSEEMVDGSNAAAAAASAAAEPVSSSPKAIPTDDISMQVGMSPVKFPGDGANFERVTVRVNVPDELPTLPVDVCAAIDCSFSMQWLSKLQDPNDETKEIESRFTRLDIVRHAVKAVIHSLGEHDRLSIVSWAGENSTYGPVVKTDMPLTYMNAAGKQKALAALKSIQYRNATDIFAGVKASLDALKSVRGNRNRFAMVLTDGEPNRGCTKKNEFYDAMVDYKEKNPDLKVHMSVCGFTYDLYSDCLLELAKQGGSFSFLPDALTVGPVFVNFAAFARCTVNIAAKLHVAAKGGAKLADEAHALADPTHKHKRLSWGDRISLGPLVAGQSRDVTLLVDCSGVANDATEILDITLELPHPVREEPRKLRLAAKLGDAKANPVIGAVGDARATFCAALGKICEIMDKTHMEAAFALHIEAKSHIGKLLTAIGGRNETISALMEDVAGRSLKAFSTSQRWQRWGRHYARALYRNHQLQICANNLDIGLQQYGQGKRFQAYVEAGAEAFKHLPMESSLPEKPKPVAAAPKAAAATTTTTTTTAAKNNYSDSDSDNNYYGGGCFAASCTVQTDGASKKFSTIRRGDRLRMADGSFSTVKILVELRKARGDLVEFEDSGLLLTPNHPVRLAAGAEWIRPHAVKSVATKKRQTAPAVFNVIFEQKPACGLLVNGVECVTYHHDIAELEHPFYSTDKIVERLRECEGFEQGNVVVRAASLK